jgi:hypothetical protein
MDFRHNAARRRRVMRDERPDVEHAVALDADPQPFRRYQTAMVLANQPSLVDLVPKSPWLIGLWGVLSSTAVVGLLCLPLVVTADSVGVASALGKRQWWSIEEPGSLGQLVLLFLSISNVALCYQIYHLRRHRNDDYHGAYQIWKWAVIPATLIAIAGTSVPAAMLGFLAAAALPESMSLLGTGLTLGVSGVIISGLLTRLYFEVRDSRVATGFLAATGVMLLMCLVLSWNRQTQFWTLPDVDILKSSGWWLLSVTMTNGMLLSYFGFVYRDVLGGQEDRRASDESEPNAEVSVSSVRNPSVHSNRIAEEWNATSGVSSDRVNELESVSDRQEIGAASNEGLSRRKRRRAA